MPTLLAVPNVSEGRDAQTIREVAGAFARVAPVRLLDSHSDFDHHRSVFTIAGPPQRLADALLSGARAVLERVDIGDGRGVHPHVGALDVAPVVYPGASARGAACAEALVVAERIGGELAVPVFLYGDLAGGRTRAQLRSGGLAGLARRIAAGELSPDFGPPRLHPSAGATLVAAREPLVAFNVELAPPATVEDARRIAALVRDGGEEGLPGVRAIGVPLRGGEHGGPPRAQLSMNVESATEVPLVEVLARVARHATLARGELVGLAPEAAFAGFPAELPMGAFDPDRQLLERVLARAATEQP